MLMILTRDPVIALPMTYPPPKNVASYDPMKISACFTTSIIVRATYSKSIPYPLFTTPRRSTIPFTPPTSLIVI